MVLAELVNCLLFLCVSLRADDFVHPPLIAACRTEHTAHEVIASVRVCKGMQRIELIHTELLRGNEDRSAGSERDITHIVAHRSGSDSCRRVVARACRHLAALGDSELCRNLRKNCADCLIALVAFCELRFADAADVAHLLRPLAVLYVKQQHPGRIGHIRTVYACQFICDIILGKHDLCNLCKIFRLLVLHPENLRCRKSRERNICGIPGELLLADDIVQVIRLLRCTSVIPENRRADHVVLLVEDHKPMHLSAKADASHLTLIHVLNQRFDSVHRLRIPVLRLLLRPARMREIQRVLP